MVHVRIWKFRPRKGREREFEKAYASDGSWPALFRRAKGFRGSDLLRPLEPGGWWITIDRWESAEDFEAFQRDLGKDYRVLDAELEGVAGEERFLGAFEEAD